MLLLCCKNHYSIAYEVYIKMKDATLLGWFMDKSFSIKEAQGCLIGKAYALFLFVLDFVFIQKNYRAVVRGLIKIMIR